ncbi:hypothetical protein KR009_002046 [Drosophila setifemur]|nr:hypothetical protein KR009_002046 [Drosophila setifemur]
MTNKNCRICSGQEATVNLFHPENGHLIRQIHSITGVEVKAINKYYNIFFNTFIYIPQLSNRMELPRFMCKVCVGDLQGAIKFRQRCIISEKQNLERIDSFCSIKEFEPILHEDIDDSQVELLITKSDHDEVLSPVTEGLFETSGAEKVTANFRVPKPVVKAGQPYVCGDCGKSINNWTNFQEHKLRHTGIKNFKCQISDCGKSFATKKELTRHNRSHTGEKPYACSYCPRRFSDVGSRQEHHRRHRDERRYQCDVCEKSFVSSGCLSKHKMTHTSTEERQHYCDICDKRFQRNSHLRSHLATSVHLEKAQSAAMDVFP